MRVAMISMHTSPLEQPGSGDAGGMNVYVLQSARHLARAGVQVDIFTRATRPSQGDVVNVEENLRVINIVAGPYEGLAKDELATQLAAFAGGIIAFVRCHPQRMRAEEGQQPYDVIHSHYWLSGQVGWLLRDLWQIPLVHTAHTLAAVKNSSHQSAGTESESRRICEQQLVDNADALVVNTQEEEADLEFHYDADVNRIIVVPPGADTALFSPGTGRTTEASRRALGVPLHVKVVAFVGRLQEFKGPQVLIRAVAELVKRGHNLRVLMCGGASGVSATHYQDLVRDMGVTKYIRFLEPRPPQELVTVYQAADVVAVPSYNESFGLVALEAQATGTPVVAAAVGGLPVAVADGQTGVLVPGHEPEHWADALEQILLDDAQRIAMGEAAVDHAAKFSWDAMAGRLQNVYDDVMNSEATICPKRRAGGA